MRARGPLLVLKCLRAFVLAIVLGCCTPRDGAGPSPAPSTDGPSPFASSSTPSSSSTPAAGGSSPASTSDTTLFAARGAVVVDTPAGPLRFGVELALTDAERQRGLMHRTQLADDAGMLFIFDHSRVQSFWMKNTLIPLDMIFIEEGGAIAGIVESAEPLTTTARRVDRKSRYVLELNGGAARRFGIAPGQLVHFEGVAADRADPAVISRTP